MGENKSFYEKFNLRWNLQLPLSLLLEALTHPSYKSVDPTANTNRRLETLGDSVIDLLVVDWFYNHDVENEGILTIKRAEIVQNTTLTEVGKQLQIKSLLRCAPAYKIQEKDLADTVEAIFGAIYTVNGLKSCQALLLQLFEDYLQKILLKEKEETKVWGRNEKNPKNLVQEFFHQQSLPSPVYQLLKKEGEDHSPRYSYTCQGTFQNQILIGKGHAKTKKEAQKNAAYDLYLQLQQLER